MPCLAHSTALSGSNTTCPDTAPGDAGNPFATGTAFALGSILGYSSCSTCSGDTFNIASSFVSIPSLAISTAVFTLASGVILALRVCRKYSFPLSTVNSMSCTSLFSFSKTLAALYSWSYSSGNFFWNSSMLIGVLIPATTSSP